MGLNENVSTFSPRKVVFHTLRHTFCSWLAIRGVPLYTIAKLAVHSKPDMTQRYAQSSLLMPNERPSGIYPPFCTLVTPLNI